MEDRPKSILDFMTEEHREKAKQRGEQRTRKTAGKQHDISPEVYLIAELGFHFGWPAIEAVRRGYIDYIDEDGQYQQSVFTLEEASVLAEAAKKVWHARLYEQSFGTAVASASKFAKNPTEAFRDGMKPFRG